MKKIFFSLVFAFSVLCLVGCQSDQGEQSQSSGSEQSNHLTAQVDVPVSADLSDDLVTESYSVRRGDIELQGVLTGPKNYRDLHLPLVIVAHGFNNTLEMYDNYAQLLAEQGYLVYRFDFYGGSHQSKSGGQDMLDMSVLTELADLTVVVNQLRQETFVDTNNLNLLGFSQGGVVASLFAAEQAALVNKLLLVFPAFVLFDDVEATYESYGVSSPSELPELISHRNAQLGAVYLTDAMTVDLDQLLGKIDRPTLLVHGTEDTVVPYAYAERAVATMADAQLVTVDGGGHWIDERFYQLSAREIVQFLER